MPPTSIVRSCKIGKPPGKVPIPRGCAVGRMPVTCPYDSGATRSPPGGMYCGGTLNRVPVIVLLSAVAVCAFDAEQVDLRREHDAWRKVSLDSDGSHESWPVQGRIAIRVRYVGVGLHFALGDRRLTDLWIVRDVSGA